jgi:hypothetical protein
MVRTAIAAASLGIALNASAAVIYHYVDWKSADAVAGSASGIITLPDASTVTVTFQAVNQNGSNGSFDFGQTDGLGTNYWNPSTPYISSQVSNAPLDSDIIALVGGTNQTYKVTLSEAIKDPIMAIVSLGQPGNNTTYDFDSPFTIVSQGVGHWGWWPESVSSHLEGMYRNRGQSLFFRSGCSALLQRAAGSNDRQVAVASGVAATRAI